MPWRLAPLLTMRWRSRLFGECARVLEPGGILAVTEQVSDPDFQLPSTVRTLAAAAGLREDGLEGLSSWTYSARYRR